MNRRSFLQAGVLAAGALRPAAPAAAQPQAAPLRNRICLFTDHLDDSGFTYAEVAAHLAQLGISGPDLTVRSGGLVPPERASEELPKAVAAFRERGLAVPMLTTHLTAASDPAARAILAAMRTLGIRHYKLGYYHYDDPARWRTRLEAVRREVEGLVRLGREFGVTAGLHNHAGASVGGAIWDGWELLQPLDAQGVGFYYDPAQATIEGGNHGWKLGFHRVSERLKMVAIKDFVWEKTGGEWRTRWVPLGEGMVRWPEFFRMLAQVPFDGPLSLHIEYDPGGATKAARLENSLAAATRDLKFLRGQIDAAFPKG